MREYDVLLLYTAHVRVTFEQCNGVTVLLQTLQKSINSGRTLVQLPKTAQRKIFLLYAQKTVKIIIKLQNM